MLLLFESLDYSRALRLQRRLVEEKLRNRGLDIDKLLILEHPPTITLGHRDAGAQLLMSEDELQMRGISVVQSDRGGQATYHGPGQIVCYPIIDLRAAKLSVREYVYNLEEVIIRTLSKIGINGNRIPGQIGVWIAANEKIASIGVRVTQRVAYHGFSLNTNLISEVSKFVVLCGAPETKMISITDVIGQVEKKVVQSHIIETFAEIFNYQIVKDNTELKHGNSI